MQYLVDSLIYLTAIIGIIFTTISIYEIVNLKKEDIKSKSRVYTYSKCFKRNIEIKITFNNFDEENDSKIVEMIENDEKVNLKEIADYIIVEKYE